MSSLPLSSSSRNSIDSEIAYSYRRNQQRKPLDKEAEAAMTKCLSQPRRHTAPESRPCPPKKLVYVRQQNTGRLAPTMIPLPARSKAEQDEYMSSMHEKAPAAKQARDAKLAQKYLQPLAPAKRLISGINDMVDHLLALDNLHHGVASQTAASPYFPGML